MKKLFTIFITLAGLAFSNSVYAQTTIYRFDSIVDGTGERLTATDIAVEGSMIVAIGSELDGKHPDAELVVMDGLTALPGLIDAHTHITYGLSESPKGDAWAELGTASREDRYDASKRNALLTLATGVTSIRDLNADQNLDFELRDKINAGELAGPRIFTSGPGIHPFNDPLPEGMETATAEFMFTAANRRIDMGADWIKIFGTTGSASDLTSRAYFTADAIMGAAEAARLAGKRITVHSYGPEAVDAAISAGVTSLDHPVGISKQQIEAMRDNGIIYVPTIDHNRYYADHGGEYGYGPLIQASLHVFVGRNMETVRQAHAAGVTVAMGSDAVLTGFGENTCELRAFVAAGMTTAEAIKTATVNGARLLGQDDKLGRLKEGYIADIVAVSSDPLADINAIISGVTVVLKDGEIVIDHRANSETVNKPDCGTLY